MSIEKALNRPVKTPLDLGAWRLSLRMACGSVLGLVIAKVAGWPFGAFFAVYPMLLLGLAPTFNTTVVAQFVGAILASILAASALLKLGANSPLAATVLFAAFAGVCFSLMASNRAFLFGALATVATSILVHLGSHPGTPQQDLFMAQVYATLISVCIGAMMHAVWPIPPQAAPQARSKPPALVRHQALLGTACATLSYVAFQLIDLQDALSAQVATVLILLPMSLEGSVRAAWTRVKGTLGGSAVVLTLQLLLQGNIGELPILTPFYFASALLFTRLHAEENQISPVGPATGFSGATAVAVLIGQLTPSTDLYGVSLYRISSVVVAIGAALVCVYGVSSALNAFESTRQPVSVRTGRIPPGSSDAAPVGPIKP